MGTVRESVSCAKDRLVFTNNDFVSVTKISESHRGLAECKLNRSNHLLFRLFFQDWVTVAHLPPARSTGRLLQQALTYWSSRHG